MGTFASRWKAAQRPDPCCNSSVFIKVRSCRWIQDGTGEDLADRDVAHRAISSLRANATIMALRNPGFAPAVRARYHFAKALLFWM